MNFYLLLIRSAFVGGNEDSSSHSVCVYALWLWMRGESGSDVGSRRTFHDFRSRGRKCFADRRQAFAMSPIAVSLLCLVIVLPPVVPAALHPLSIDPADSRRGNSCAGLHTRHSCVRVFVRNNRTDASPLFPALCPRLQDAVPAAARESILDPASDSMFNSIWPMLQPQVPAAAAAASLSCLI